MWRLVATLGFRFSQFLITSLISALISAATFLLPPLPAPLPGLEIFARKEAIWGLRTSPSLSCLVLWVTQQWRDHVILASYWSWLIHSLCDLDTDLWFVGSDHGTWLLLLISRAYPYLSSPNPIPNSQTQSSLSSQTKVVRLPERSPGLNWY